VCFHLKFQDPHIIAKQNQYLKAAIQEHQLIPKIQQLYQLNSTTSTTQQEHCLLNEINKIWIWENRCRTSMPET